MKQLVFFASGSGTNFQSVIDAVEAGKIHANIAGLITNRKGVQAVERAEDHQIPVQTLAPADFETTRRYEQALVNIVEKWEPDLIVLAGYLLKIPVEVIHKFRGKIINIHPSLLPDYGGKGFYGMNVHEAVLKAGEQETGCTVHIVTKEYDEGRVLGQRKVPVFDADTPKKLASRVLEQEHKLLPEVISNLVEGPDYYSDSKNT